MSNLYIYLIYDNDKCNPIGVSFRKESKAIEWCDQHNATYCREKYSYESIVYYE